MVERVRALPKRAPERRDGRDWARWEAVEGVLVDMVDCGYSGGEWLEGRGSVV